MGEKVPNGWLGKFVGWVVCPLLVVIIVGVATMWRDMGIVIDNTVTIKARLLVIDGKLNGITKADRDMAIDNAKHHHTHNPR